jgi:hypothetical protein
MTIETILVFIAIVLAAVAVGYWQDFWWRVLDVYRPGDGSDEERSNRKELREFFKASLAGEIEKVGAHLESYPADVEASMNREPVLNLVARKGKSAVLSVLLENKPDISTEQLRTMLYLATKYGNTGAAEIIVKKGLDLDYKDNLGRTPLEYAVAKGKHEIAEIIKEHKED